MRFATLISWVLTASLGGFMLRTWLARDGLRTERAKAEGLPPQLIFGHAAMALTGLLLWSGYVAAGARALAWAAVVALGLAVCLGLSMVTLWTPYPARRPGERRAVTPWDEPLPPVPDTPAAAVAAVRGDGEQYLVTDEMLIRLTEGSFGRPRPQPISLDAAMLVPVAHGFAAMATLVLAMMTASM